MSSSGASALLTDTNHPKYGLRDGSPDAHRSQPVTASTCPDATERALNFGPSAFAPAGGAAASSAPAPAASKPATSTSSHRYNFSPPRAPSSASGAGPDLLSPGTTALFSPPAEMFPWQRILSDGLCGCCDEPGLCVASFLCSPCVAGQNFHLAGRGSCLAGCVLTTCLCGLQRQHTQRLLGVLEQSTSAACLTHLFCRSCAVSQEARALRSWRNAGQPLSLPAHQLAAARAEEELRREAYDAELTDHYNPDLSRAPPPAPLAVPGALEFAWPVSQPAPLPAAGARVRAGGRLHFPQPGEDGGAGGASAGAGAGAREDPRPSSLFSDDEGELPVGSGGGRGSGIRINFTGGSDAATTVTATGFGGGARPPSKGGRGRGADRGQRESDDEADPDSANNNNDTADLGDDDGEDEFRGARNSVFGQGRGKGKRGDSGGDEVDSRGPTPRARTSLTAATQAHLQAQQQQQQQPQQSSNQYSYGASTTGLAPALPELAAPTVAVEDEPDDSAPSTGQKNSRRYSFYPVSNDLDALQSRSRSSSAAQTPVATSAAAKGGKGLERRVSHVASEAAARAVPTIDAAGTGEMSESEKAKLDYYESMYGEASYSRSRQQSFVAAGPGQLPGATGPLPTLGETEAGRMDSGKDEE